MVPICEIQCMLNTESYKADQQEDLRTNAPYSGWPSVKNNGIKTYIVMLSRT